MTLDFLDDIFLLNLPLKPAKCIFKGFPLLNSNLCQKKYTSKHPHMGSSMVLQYRFMGVEKSEKGPISPPILRVFRTLRPLTKCSLYCKRRAGTLRSGHSRLEALTMIRSYQGHTPLVPTSCYVDPSAQLLGDVELGENSSVWMNAVVRGDVNSIRIGANSNVQDCAVLHGMRYKYPVVVGSWVTIGHNATVHGCVIEDACLIGIGAIILNNARIGEGSIIAAGAVIPEHTVIEPNTLWAGVPGKERRKLEANDREMILMYAKNYLDYVQIYLKEQESWG